MSDPSPLKIVFGADLPSSAFTLATAVAKVNAELGKSAPNTIFKGDGSDTTASIKSAIETLVDNPSINVNISGLVNSGAGDIAGTVELTLNSETKTTDAFDTIA